MVLKIRIILEKVLNKVPEHSISYEKVSGRICHLPPGDSDQKSIIDHFRLIGPKTIVFFSIVEFRSLIFDHSTFE